jgi:2-keto-4-pentenoate hydratase/2-oxohepta-3-ene-1,7-dioic acid hydratase in catechol pathway
VKLVTFGEEMRVGVLTGRSPCSTCRRCGVVRAGRGGRDRERVALAETRLRAPILLKKLFHTAGNFREHEEESKNAGWSHDIAPWINFFQNVDAIVGPDEPVIYPEHYRGARLRTRARRRAEEGRCWFSPEEALDYVGGYVIFNDITARHPAG